MTASPYLTKYLPVQSHQQKHLVWERVSLVFPHVPYFLPQKCWFCNFHAVFGYFAQIFLSQVEPIWETLWNMFRVSDKYKRTTLTSVTDSLFKATVSGLRQRFATESPLKMMKNAFNFISKALFVLKMFKYLSFCLDFLVM